MGLPRTVTRIVIRTAIIAALLVAVVVIAAAAYLSGATGEDRIREMLETRLGGALGVTLTIDSFETDVLRHATVHGVTVIMPDGSTLATLGSGTVRYSLIDLAALRLSLSSIALDSLRVTLHRDSTGTFTLPGTRGEPSAGCDGGGSPIAVSLGRIILTGTELTYDDNRIPLDSTFRGVDATIRTRFTGGYDIRVSAREGSTTYENLPVTLSGLTISAVYDEGVATVSRIAAMFGGTKLAGSAGIDTNARPVAVTSHYTLTGPVDPLASLLGTRLPGRLKPLTGDILIEGMLDYGAQGLTADVTVSGASMGIGGIEFPSLTMHGGYRGHEVAIDSLRAVTQSGGAILAEGTVTLDSLITHQATVSLTGIRADRLWQLVRGTDSHYAASIDLELSSNGPLRDILNTTVTASLHATGISYLDHPFADLTANFRYGNRVLSLIALQDSSRAECALSLVDERLDGEFFGDIARIGIVAGFLNDLDLTGSAIVTGTVGGTLDTPAVSAAFHGRNMQYRGFPSDRIDGSLTYRPGAFRLEPTMVTGRVDSVKTLRFPPLPEGLTGGFSYNGTFSYGDEGFAGDVAFDLDSPGYREIQFGTGAATVAIRDTLVTLRKAQLDADSLTIGLNGVFSIPGRALHLTVSADDSSGHAGTATIVAALGDETGPRVDIDVPGIDIARVKRLVPGAPGIGGRLGGRLSYHAAPDGPDVAAVVTIVSLAMSHITLDRVVAGGSLTGGTARLDSLRILTPSGTLNAAGTLSLSRTASGGAAVTDMSRTQGWMRSDGIDVAIAAGYLPEQSSMSGSVTADVHWDGTLADPGLSGSIALTGGSFLAAPGALPVEAIETALRLDHSDIVIERWSATSQGITLSGRGTVSVRGIMAYDADVYLAVNGTDAFHGEGRYDNGEMDGSLRFDSLDLAALQGVSPAVTRLGGTVRGNIEINGAPSLANMAGQVTAEGMTFRPAALNESVSNGHVAVTFDHEQVRLDTLSFALGGGTVAGNGTMTLDGNIPRDLSLALRGRDIALRKRDMYDINIESVALSGSVTETGVVLDGDMIFGESRLTRSVRTRDIIQFTREKPARAGTPRPFIDTARLNIRVRDSEDIWIDNNMAKLKVHPELVIIGTPRAPVITGRFTADEGYIYYLDRKFDLNRCHIDFTDPNRNNPMLDIQAETTVRSSSQLSDEPFVITLTISGEAEDPRFDLASTPALDQADILSVLTFGATRSELAGASGTILQDRARMLGSQQISNYLSREARSFLGLDDLSIQGNLFDAGKAAGPQLLASDSISDRLRITYTTTVGEQNEQSIRLDYQLSRFFSVEGQTNQDGDSGLDLKYRIKF